MFKPENSTLEGMQRSHIEALRHREEEIFRYLAILGPALGGFFWLLLKARDTILILTAGTIGIQLLLLLGAVYSLALGYNYRCIVLQLAKLQVHFKLTDVILKGWPQSKKAFLKCYCIPPEIIKVFWLAFLIGIAFVTITASIASIEKAGEITFWLVILIGCSSILAGFIMLPIIFGCKLRKLCEKEPESWCPADCGKTSMETDPQGNSRAPSEAEWIRNLLKAGTMNDAEIEEEVFKAIRYRKPDEPEDWARARAKFRVSQYRRELVIKITKQMLAAGKTEEEIWAFYKEKYKERGEDFARKRMVNYVKSAKGERKG